MKILKQLFCGHHASIEVCKIHYNPDSTDLIYTKLCKDCGKRMGKPNMRTISSSGK